MELKDHMRRERDEIDARISNLELEMDELRRACAACDAYFQALKEPTKVNGRRVGLSDQALEVIRRHAKTGIRPFQVADALGIRDRKGRNSVAQAVNNLRDKGLIASNGDSLYRPVK